MNRDLKGENIIARDLGNGRYEFFIVDFDGIACRRVSQRMRVKNLARLARAVAAKTPLTSTDRLRFVKNYLGGREGSPWRKMYRDLVRFVVKFHHADARGLIAVILWEWS